jgi:hypothetical protein
MKQKYIVYKSGGLEDIMVFSELLNHSEAARAVGRENVISAGFMHVEPDGEYELKCSCYGSSTTLDLQSRGEVDAKVAMLRLYGNPY